MPIVYSIARNLTWDETTLAGNGVPFVQGSLGDTQIGFGNGAGVIGGESGFTFDPSTNVLSLGDQANTIKFKAVVGETVHSILNSTKYLLFDTDGAFNEVTFTTPDGITSSKDFVIESGGISGAGLGGSIQLITNEAVATGGYSGDIYLVGGTSDLGGGSIHLSGGDSANGAGGTIFINAAAGMTPGQIILGGGLGVTVDIQKDTLFRGTVNIADKVLFMHGGEDAILRINAEASVGNPALQFQSVGGTLASPTSSSDGDILATYMFLGVSSADAINTYGAQMTVNVDGTPGAGFVPTNFQFTTVDASGGFHSTKITRDGGIIASAFTTASEQGAFTASPYGTGAGQTGEMRFKELAANGVHHVGLKAPDALASDLIFTLPSVDAAGPLVSDGSKVLSALTGANGSIVIPGVATLTVVKGIITAIA
jgi:hypothetical protein